MKHHQVTGCRYEKVIFLNFDPWISIWKGRRPVKLHHQSIGRKRSRPMAIMKCPCTRMRQLFVGLTEMNKKYEQ